MKASDARSLKPGDLMIYSGCDFRIKCGEELTFLKFGEGSRILFSDSFYIICKEYPFITIPRTDLYLADQIYILSCILHYTKEIKKKYCI